VALRRLIPRVRFDVALKPQLDALAFQVTREDFPAAFKVMEPTFTGSSWLEHYSDVDFAVILLTPDDIGASKRAPDNLQPRIKGAGVRSRSRCRDPRAGPYRSGSRRRRARPERRGRG
jgi:hypothetical protein